MLKVTCAIIEENGKVLCAQRSEAQSLPFKWELPGGKVEVGESDDQAICRELKEELGITVEVIEALQPNQHQYADKQIELLPFRCKIVAGKPEALEHKQIQWIHLDQLVHLDWAEADIPIIEKLLLRI